ncbi:MAG: hypothetical protein WCG01_05645, partial [bacterium]
MNKIYILIALIFLLGGCSSNQPVEGQLATSAATSSNESASTSLDNANSLDVDMNMIAEETLSAADLKTMYGLFNDPYVIHIRKALNGYLAGTNIGLADPKNVIAKRSDGKLVYGLSAFSKVYYKSKYFVWQIDKYVKGGKDVTIIFQDKPDRIFHAWIDYTTNNNQYVLRGFWENTQSSKG